MNDLIRYLNEIAAEYAGGRPHLLYYPVSPSDLSVFTKPYQSLLNKVYRINCINNRRFPDRPDKGFVDYSSMYEHENMNDLLRARLVCKYMDGPKFVASALASFCKERCIKSKYYSMNNDLGYYAWHFYFRIPVEIMVNEGVEEKCIWFELQLTTQLSELITGLTHGLYEGRRSTQPSNHTDQKWRWEPRSQLFRSAYLGHTLHLLEGVIQTFRDEVLDLMPGKDMAISEMESASAPISGSAPTVNAEAMAGRDSPSEADS